jgi:DNA invertase Pin-like site-specific DNA recombinase
VFAEREGWLIADAFHHHAISGATLLRPGFEALMRRSLVREFDIVLAESLDRFSRDQEDTAGLFKRLTFLGVRTSRWPKARLRTSTSVSRGR